MTKLSEMFDRAFAGFDEGNLEEVVDLVARLRESGAGDDARLRFLALMVEGNDEDDEDLTESLFERAIALLDDAVEIAEPRHATFVTRELADLLAATGEVDEAEHALRTLAEREDLDPQTAGEVRLAWAAVLFDDQEDPREALAVLDEAATAVRTRSDYASLRAAVYMELERPDEAVALLEEALDREDETELRYQLGVILSVLGRSEDALSHLLEVRRRDLARHEIDPEAKVDSDEAEDLRRLLEELLETLPDPVLKTVATAAIRVERWPSEDAVRAGCDPRNALAFEGQPETDEAAGHADAIVIYRDVLITSIDHDDEIIDSFALALAEEFGRFFAIELTPGA